MNSEKALPETHIWQMTIFCHISRWIILSFVVSVV